MCDLLDDNGEDMETSADILAQLEEAWLNEKFCPELLEAKTELLDCILEQIQAMEENIRRAKRGDFKVSLHKMEIDRIRYIVSSYLRIRLNKIEQNTASILEQERRRAAEEDSRLSPQEFTFAKEYQDNLDSHFNSLALRLMPPNLQAMDPKQTTVHPSLDSFVFLRVNEDTEGVLIEEETVDVGEEIVDLVKGDQHVMRYRPVSALLATGCLSLI